MKKNPPINTKSDHHLPYYVFLDPTKHISELSGKYNYPNGSLWTHVRSYDDFVSLLSKNGMPCAISFCHNFTKEHKEQSDISQVRGSFDYKKLDNKTGYHCAKWLCAFARICKKSIPDYYTHEDCKHGNFNIRKILEAYKAGVLNEEALVFNRPIKLIEEAKETSKIIVPVSFKPTPKPVRVFNVTKFEA